MQLPTPYFLSVLYEHLGPSGVLSLFYRRSRGSVLCLPLPALLISDSLLQPRCVAVGPREAPEAAPRQSTDLEMEVSIDL